MINPLTIYITELTALVKLTYKSIDIEHLQVSNITELEQRVEILEVEVESLTDDVEDVEVDVNQVDDRMTVIEETVIGNTNDISGMFFMPCQL